MIHWPFQGAFPEGIPETIYETVFRERSIYFSMLREEHWSESLQTDISVPEVLNSCANGAGRSFHVPGLSFPICSIQKAALPRGSFPALTFYDPLWALFIWIDGIKHNDRIRGDKKNKQKKDVAWLFRKERIAISFCP